METNKLIPHDGKINRESAEFKELVALMRETTRIAEKVAVYTAPSLFNERYLTTNEIIALFRISRRTLQNYRDNGTIPYISMGRVVLYPESELKKAWEKNYYKPTF